MTSQVIIYSDGSCGPGNPGKGGWGAVIQYPNVKRYVYGGSSFATNNAMEMTAALRALEALSAPFDVILHTDSQYVQKGMTQWLKGWKRRNWVTSVGTPVKNAELWIALDRLNCYHQIDWRWVRGHNGDRMNELADELANQGRIEQCDYKIV